MPGDTWWLIVDVLARAGALLAQERMYEWRWETHPMWWGWGIGMMAMMFLFWALFIVGLIVEIRWAPWQRQRAEAGFGARDTPSEICTRRDQQR